MPAPDGGRHDQFGRGDHVAYQRPGGAGGSDVPASATSEAHTVGGAKAYSLFVNARNSYWRDVHQTGIPTGSAPEGMVTSGTHVNGGCCVDYGNSETRRADGPGAITLGSGGDCGNGNTDISVGTFYEGTAVSGFPTDATENAVQADVISAGYR